METHHHMAHHNQRGDSDDDLYRDDRGPPPVQQQLDDDAVSNDPEVANYKAAQGQYSPWVVSVLGTVPTRCALVFYNALCCCITTVVQRNFLLGDTDYFCCGRAIPICCLKDPCPRWCACCEALWCPIMALMVNRIMIEERYGLEPSSFLDGTCACCVCCCMSAQHTIQLSVAESYSGPERQEMTEHARQQTNDTDDGGGTLDDMLDE